MRRRTAITLALGAAAWLIAAPATHAHGGGSGAHPSCIEHRASSRYQGAGYTHVVIVESSCEQAAACEVSTNVDPEPVHRLRVPAGETREVVTRIGSPAYAFTENVRCELD